MLGKCFAVICLISVIFAVFTGNLGNLANAAIDGCEEAVKLVFALVGMMSLWSGILSVLSDSGVVDKLGKLLSPVMRLAFPEAWQTGIGRREITASVAANVLGIGNAATPFAISAISEMQAACRDKTVATPDMITLAVLGSSTFNLFPTTIITLLKNAGSTRPYGVIVPIWICSGVCSVFAVTLSRLFGKRR